MNELEIAQNATKEPIEQICARLNIDRKKYEPIGNYIAKVQIPSEKKLDNDKLVLVTAMNSTPAGEGKTTLSIGLADAMNARGYNTVLALREPSMGPVMGRKGGATGGGYSQVVPRAEIDLHFTGDFHAIQIANNTLAALIDNDIYQGNPHQLDPKSIIFTRILDVNDRALREIVIGLGSRVNGVTRPDQFEITAASELMAILCLAEDYVDLKKRIGSILIGFTYSGEPVTVDQLGFAGPIAAILSKALRPNLVQTLDHTPVFMHGGPFANIAHGANSILATKLALKYGDYAITEAGFGADLGAEKFIDLVSRKLGTLPKVIVIVASVRSLKFQVLGSMTDMQKENVAAVKEGYVNLQQHLNNLTKTGIKVVVGINKFTNDTEEELAALTQLLDQDHFNWAISETYELGADGGKQLAELVHQQLEKPISKVERFYDSSDDLETKIEKVATKVYHADGIELSPAARKSLAELKKFHWDELPICIAKTPQSFSDDAGLLGAPKGFTLQIRDLLPKLGAGFIVVYTGKILTMPGLPQHPAALDIDLDAKGNILGPV
ncbi:formate--tetrahydrofolate ligase [Xylocopilactobacillus apicola]|uniref:Formate--tetrahydrofolate ligase n=1 Tax=Xylocopilactobacillus apicola TaxID=2932184 RepID=A0AAU9DCS2_9LACO|nr:formate--tetrahydrofolate ligase [Xylocopilactobacillus apicola]BDR58607.1 formate--tetrahydrofolate ligase [Xylocopilactobacillus apicola]